MVKSVAHYMEKIRLNGLPALMRRRLKWYWNIMGLKYQNKHTVGKFVEMTGNRVRIEGMVFSLDSPAIETIRKGSLFFGIYESAERALLNQWLPPDLPVVEFGGGIGVVSCLANRKLVRPAQHIVVEANPNLISLLERNRDLNQCRFQVWNRALAYGTESVAFRIHSHFLSGRVEGNKGSTDSGLTVPVPATSLKAVIEQSGFDQLSLICDIEGAEITLVEREIGTICQHVRCFLVELHPEITGEEAVSRLIETLRTAGFTIRAENGSNLLLERQDSGGSAG
jgi:FkbM family methyltransferase